MPQTATTAYQVRISESLIDEVDRVAFELSTPSEKVSRSDVIRAGFRDYSRKHSSTLEDCDPWERGEPGETPRKPVSVTFVESESERLKAVAFDLSTPKRDVTVSDVLRAGLRDYLEKHEGDLRECDPAAEGELVRGGA